MPWSFPALPTASLGSFSGVGEKPEVIPFEFLAELHDKLSTEIFECRGLGASTKSLERDTSFGLATRCNEPCRYTI